MTHEVGFTCPVCQRFIVTAIEGLFADPGADRPGGSARPPAARPPAAA